MSLKAIIFYWDLTLWNSWDMHIWIMQETADALGLPRPEVTAMAREYSRPFLQHLAWFFGDDEDAVLGCYLEFYVDNVASMAGLYPDTAETLRTLKRNGFRLAVFSDKRRKFGISELDQTGISYLLDHASFLVDGRPYKPDPRGLQEVISALGVSPDETLYIGDGRQDVECAHQAGARSGAALWGSVDRRGLLSLRPHYRWERIGQILGTLGKEVCLGDEGLGNFFRWYRG